MFEASLLRARVVKGTIYPILAPINAENIGLCKEIAQVYSTMVGRKKKALIEELARVERRHDYRLVRGLAELFERASVYEPGATAVPPKIARESVFSASGGLAVSEEARKTALEAASSAVAVPVDDLERSLYADLDDELILKKTDQIPNDEMIRRYNTELVETLIIRAVKLRVSLNGGWQPVFRKIKQYGLMYEISGSGEQTSVEIYGPAQLFKLMDRYGSEMAKLLPAILKAGDWNISADILSRDKKRVMTFTMARSDLLYSGPPDDKYDSSVEERFARSFSGLGMKWAMRREAEVISAGQWAFIPDFVFALGDRKVYFEIVGFWTKEYIERKIAKLKLLPPEIDLVIAVNKDLACSGIANASKDVFFYSGDKVPVKPVMTHLAAVEKQLSDGQSAILQFTPSGPVFDLLDFAEKNGVLVSAVTKRAEAGFQGYIRAGDYFISADEMEKLKRLLIGVKDYGRAAEILEGEGIMRLDGILEALHYTVKWKDLLTAELVPSA
jgi:predicted nuclease of restriction endonuclease-like RecB superfamily